MRFFESQPTREDEILAEALGLLDDGLDAAFVAGLYPEDEEWLAPMLGVTTIIGETYDAEPSYYFEASLKAKVLAASRDRTAQAPVPGFFNTFRSAAAGATVMAGAALFGVLTLGFVTADQSVPGDWNYTFKLAGEQFRYSLSQGEGRIDLQIEFTENRVAEINKKLEAGGAVSPGDIAKVEREARELAARLNSSTAVDDGARRARLTELGERSTTVLSAAKDLGIELESPVDSAILRVNEAVVAGSGGTSLLPDPTATPTATVTVEPTETPTPEPTATATPEPTETPEPTATPEPPTETPTPEPTPEAEATAEPLETDDNEFAQE